jgi:cyclopropane fatty-acyl-phospholipid synthase-like methyltransferase
VLAPVAHLGLSDKVPIREEAELEEVYSQRFRSDVFTAGLAAEREAMGSDYGANGYLDAAQADELAERLALAPADTLLDIGAGTGWPGLYLARRTGCHVVVSDLTVAGMTQALRRSDHDGTSDRTKAVVASARHLPFRPDSFDAIVHADVLC